MQAIDRSDYRSDKAYKDAQAAARSQYDTENTAYQAEQTRYNQDLSEWRARKAAWDSGENTKQLAAGAPQQALANYLASPEGRAQQNWNVGALTAPMVPAALASTYINRGIASPTKKMLYGGLEALAGEGLSQLAATQQPDALTDPAGHYSNQGWQNLMTSTGVGGFLGSARSALMKGNQAAPVAPGAATPPGEVASGHWPVTTTFAPRELSLPETTPGISWQSQVPVGYTSAPTAAAAEFSRYKGKHSDIVTEMAADFGLKPVGNKGDTVEQLLNHIPGADESTLRDVARKTNGAVDATAGVRSLRNQMKTWVTEHLGKSGRMASIMAPVAAGGAAAYALTSPDESQAGGLPTEGPRQGESLTQYRLRSLNLPSTPAGVKEMALDSAPFIGQWRQGTALGDLVTGLLRAAGRALNPPTSVMGPGSNPELARFHNWVEDQRSAHQIAAAKNSYAARQGVLPGAEQQHPLEP
jgi:hypothetical protein